jgi:hypothetical protein
VGWLKLGYLLHQKDEGLQYATPPRLQYQKPMG